MESFMSQKTGEIGPFGHLKTALVAQQAPSAGYSLGKDTVACLAFRSFGSNMELDPFGSWIRKKHGGSLRHVSHGHMVLKLQPRDEQKKCSGAQPVRSLCSSISSYQSHLSFIPLSLPEPVGMSGLHQDSSS